MWGLNKEPERRGKQSPLGRKILPLFRLGLGGNLQAHILYKVIHRVFFDRVTRGGIMSSTRD